MLYAQLHMAVHAHRSSGLGVDKVTYAFHKKKKKKDLRSLDETVLLGVHMYLCHSPIANSTL